MKVNISRIEEIVGDDQEMKNTLLQMFVDTCERVFSQLKSSLDLPEDESRKIWKDSVHELKGAAMNLGFEDLGEFCKTIEKENMSSQEKRHSLEIINDAKNKVSALL